MRVRNQVQSQPSCQHRYTQSFDDIQKYLLRSCSVNAIACQYYRALGLVEQVDEVRDFPMKLGRRFLVVRFGFRLETLQHGRINLCGLHVKRNVNPDGSTTAGQSQMNGFLQMISNTEGIFD